MNSRLYIQAILFTIMLSILYSVGIPVYLIILLAGITLIFLLLKGKLYRRLDKFLCKHIAFISRLDHLTKKIIIVIIFILFYIILKELVFLVLKFLGLDIQKIVLDKLNNSVIA